MLRIVDRLALKELLMPLLTGLAMFATLMIAAIALNDQARFAVTNNVSTRLFLTLLGLATPKFIMYSIPMAALFGTLLSVGRLSSDQEVTALRTLGVSIYRLLVPFVLVGILLSGITFVLSDRVVPYTESRLNDLRNSIRSGKLGTATQQRFVVPIHEGPANELRWLLVADEVEGANLKKVKLFYFDPRNDDKDLFITADTGVWKGDDWLFSNMRMVTLRPGNEPLVLEGAEANVPGFSITPQSLGIRKKKPEDLTVIQLHKLIDDLLKSGSKLTDTEILQDRTTLYSKYAIPLTPLFFMLLAVPLAIMPQRSSSAMGMGMALLLVLLYYVTMMVCQKLGATGALPSPVAGWAPNSVLLLAAAVLIHRREHS